MNAVYKRNYLSIWCVNHTEFVYNNGSTTKLSGDSTTPSKEHTTRLLTPPSAEIR